MFIAIHDNIETRRSWKIEIAGNIKDNGHRVESQASRLRSLGHRFSAQLRHVMHHARRRNKRRASKRYSSTTTGALYT
jgi:hypothetical protein